MRLAASLPLVATALAVPAIALAGPSGPSPRQDPYALPTATATATASPTPCPSLRAQDPTPTPNPTAVATASPAPCATPCPAARQQASPTPTANPTAVATATATPCPVITATPSPEPAGAEEVEAYLEDEVVPDVVADIPGVFGKPSAGGAYTLPVGPFEEALVFGMRLETTGARASTAAVLVAGRGRLNLPAGKRGKLKVKLTPKGKKLRRKRGKLKVRAVLTVSNPRTGAATTARRRVTLKAKKKR